jgi:DNA-binding protein HU-beta
MKRTEIVDRMAAASGWSRTAADRALRVLLMSIRASLRQGRPVTLVGFGTFSVTRRKPRRGKNPRTGHPMNVTAVRTPRFRPSRELKRTIR